MIVARAFLLALADQQARFLANVALAVLRTPSGDRQQCEGNELFRADGTAIK